MTSGSAQEAGVKLPPSSFLRVQNIKGGCFDEEPPPPKSKRVGVCVSQELLGGLVWRICHLWTSQVWTNTQNSTGVSREEG